MNVDLTNPESISRCLRQHLNEAPKAWIQIEGSHNAMSQQSSQLERVVDFDLKTQGLNARLLRVELGSVDNYSEVFSRSESDYDSSTMDEETISRCCQAVINLTKEGSYEGIIIEKDTPDIDYSSIQRSIQSIAKKVVYGGNINITFHDITCLTTIQSQTPPAQGNHISIKTSWVFEWPDHGNSISTANDISNDHQSRRRRQMWSGRIQAAMVDGTQGWIAKDDPIPPGIHFTRALIKYGLVYERSEDSVTYDENGIKIGGSGGMKFHWWGRDE